MRDGGKPSDAECKELPRGYDTQPSMETLSISKTAEHTRAFPEIYRMDAISSVPYWYYPVRARQESEAAARVMW